jgi:hypothetical protein
VDESPDVSFYVFAEPTLSAPEPEDWNVWQEAAHLRSENLYWRECVTAIVRDVGDRPHSVDVLRQAIERHVTELGTRIATLERTRRQAH